jgi:hypothetical protein
MFFAWGEVNRFPGENGSFLPLQGVGGMDRHEVRPILLAPDFFLFLSDSYLRRDSCDCSALELVLRWSSCWS